MFTSRGVELTVDCSSSDGFIFSYGGATLSGFHIPGISVRVCGPQENSARKARLESSTAVSSLATDSRNQRRQSWFNAVQYVYTCESMCLCVCESKSWLVALLKRSCWTYGSDCVRGFCIGFVPPKFGSRGPIRPIGILWISQRGCHGTENPRRKFRIDVKFRKLPSPQTFLFLVRQYFDRNNYNKRNWGLFET